MSQSLLADLVDMVLLVHLFPRQKSHVSGKSSEFTHYRYDFMISPKSEGIDCVFITSSVSSCDVEASSTEVPLRLVQARRESHVLAAHGRARQMLATSLENKKCKDIMFRLASP